jgi:hypothetical protein
MLSSSSGWYRFDRSVLVERHPQIRWPFSRHRLINNYLGLGGLMARQTLYTEFLPCFSVSKKQLAFEYDVSHLRGSHLLVYPQMLFQLTLQSQSGYLLCIYASPAITKSCQELSSTLAENYISHPLIEYFANDEFNFAMSEHSKHLTLIYAGD